MLFRLQVRGFRIVLAHPERNAEVQANLELVRPLVEGGTLIQITAASLDGRLGARARKASHGLIARKLAHLVASDAHASSVRAVGMAHAMRTVGGTAVARWMSDDVPRAICAGTSIPERPAPAGRRLWQGRA